MIGRLALAGIVVRNSILLVDFIRHLRAGGELARGAGRGGGVRFKPVFSRRGNHRAAFIIPIDLSGLAISLVFGLASSQRRPVIIRDLCRRATATLRGLMIEAGRHSPSSAPT
jgi:hypothetical protein